MAGELNKLARLDLSHPAVVNLIAAGVEGTVAYLAEDYIGADSLDAAIRQYGPAPAGQALRILTAVAGALDFAAAAGVHHGCLHPRDLLVSPDEVHITGLGIARALENVGLRPPIRRPYTAPERAQREAWDARADSYTLGILARELLLGRVSRGKRSADATVLAEHAMLLERIIMKATAARPADRFASALELVSRVQSALAGAAPAAPAVPITVDQAVASAPSAPTERKGAAERGDDLLALFDENGGPPASAAARDARPAMVAADDVLAGGDRAPAAPQEDVLGLAGADFATTPASRPLADLADLHLSDFEAAEPRARDAGDLDLSSLDDQLIASATSKDASGAEEAAARLMDVEPAPPLKGPAETPDDDRPLLSMAPDAEPAPGVPHAFRANEATNGSAKVSSHALSLVAVLVVGIVLGVVAGYALATHRSAPAAPVNMTPTAPTTATPQARPPRAVPSQPEKSAPTPPQTSSSAVRPAPTTGSGPNVPVAERASGRLIIRSTPRRASVTVNGKARGVTPLVLKNLAPGRYTVRISRRGYATEEREVTLSASQPSVTATVSLARPAAQPKASAQTKQSGRAQPASRTAYFGTISVDSSPAGSQVFVDGRLVGVTPVVVERVTAGSHVVRVDRVGFQRWAQWVQVAAGKQMRITASLEREPR